MNTSTKISAVSQSPNGIINLTFRFNRTSMESPYYDEVGVGGTINNVNQQYSQFIETNEIADNNFIQSELIHYIIKLYNKHVSPLIKIYSKMYDKTKTLSIDIFNKTRKLFELI
jgi:hypothetical protein